MDYTGDGGDPNPNDFSGRSLPTNIGNREYRGKMFPSPVAEWLYNFDNTYSYKQHDVNKDEIGGLELILKQLDTFKNGILFPDLYDLMGVTPPHGFLLIGSPGCGKTLIAKYMATHLGSRFIDFPLNMYESKWVGEAEKTLSKALDSFIQYFRITNEKVLVFIDEAEEALKDRRLEGWHGPRVNTLLRYMDGLEDREGVIYGAATNHPDKVDPAFLRAGRFDHIIQIPEYDSEALGDVFRATMVRYNRTAPYHEPFVLSPEDCSRLGVISKRRGLVPSDVNELFRLGAERKITKVIDSEDNVVSSDDCLVNSSDLENEIQNYKRFEKRRLGF